MYNRLILAGYLASDVELRYTQSGKAVASFRLAVNEPGQDKDKALFLSVVVWEKQAEVVSQYLTKGRPCLVDGRLTMRQYDVQDGSRRTVYELVAQTVRFLPDGNRQQAGAQAAGGGAVPGADYNPTDDDEVPF